MQFYANQQMRLPALKIIPAIDSVKIVQLFGQSANVSVSKNKYIFLICLRPKDFFFFSNVALFTQVLSCIMFGQSGLLQPNPLPKCSR